MGRELEIHFRLAVGEEAKEWGKSYAKVVLQDEINEKDEWLHFLIPIIDATQEEEEDVGDAS